MCFLICKAFEMTAEYEMCYVDKLALPTEISHFKANPFYMNICLFFKLCTQLLYTYGLSFLILLNFSQLSLVDIF